MENSIGRSGERGRWVLTSDGNGSGRVLLPGTRPLLALSRLSLAAVLGKRAA